MHESKKLLEALRELKEKTQRVRTMGEDAAKTTRDKYARHVDHVAALIGLAEENLHAAMERIQYVNGKKQSMMMKIRESNRFKAIKPEAAEAAETPVPAPDDSAPVIDLSNQSGQT